MLKSKKGQSDLSLWKKIKECNDVNLMYIVLTTIFLMGDIGAPVEYCRVCKVLLFSLWPWNI